MKLKKEDIAESQAIGKTIKGFHSNYRGDMIIDFTDNTFLCLTAELGWEHGDYEIVCERLHLPDWEDVLVNIGITTKEELEKWKQKQIDTDKARKEKTDRGIYEELKKKFEGAKRR